MRVIVLAGNHRQFVVWCQETGFPPQPYSWIDKRGKKWTAVYCDPQGYNLAGCYYDAYIRVGTYYEQAPELQHRFRVSEIQAEQLRKYDELPAS